MGDPWWASRIKTAIVSIGAIVLTCGVPIVAGLIATKSQREFDKTYNQTLIRYADTNADGIVSLTERREFDKKLYADKDVIIDAYGRLRYSDEKKVSLKTLTNWLKEYNPFYEIK